MHRLRGRGANSICMDQNTYGIPFISINQGLSSIIKNGEIESASRPLVDFSVLNDNLIKGIILCVKWINMFLIKVQMYSLIHHLKYNYEANGRVYDSDGARGLLCARGPRIPHDRRRIRGAHCGIL
jgi:hypothetical protein